MPEDSNPFSTSVPAILELNHVFEALAHPRRRYLLYSLRVESNWTLEELAGKIAAWESADDLPPPEDHTEAVYVSLYHTHVPKLVADDVIEFDETTERISTGPNTEQVLAVLETAGGCTDSQLEAHARGDNHEGWT